ncbi:zinc-dependent metalloprotease family protein [Chitinophaga sp. CF418]|uniref:zinc-dependent metalloprotease family protein n=1 Tax=Chitinophaga sp. CF418 TaxID=1855287 RepID=UPI0009112F97|nr:zinc-dependent metalloprotease family protein [Chitinophaga sp. CF418]SHM86011.1 archaemetzincin [Chitinophaga sp. CF418]
MVIRLLAIFLILSSCHNNVDSRKIPDIHIKILPLGKVKESYIKEAYDNIQKISAHAELLPGIEIPAMAFYAPRNRYRADSLIRWMSRQGKANEIYVGITMQDISTTKGEYADYGVMGLGYCPGKACVVSSYRLKDKQHFYKLVIHELGHNMGLQHCPVSTCYMRDAKGGDPTGEEKAFCEKCTAYLQKKGWKL